MLANQVPTPWLSPFAASGLRSVIPQAPLPAGQPNASMEGGFPPITFTPITAGGVAPLGEDFNGLGYLCSAWNQWQSLGGPIYYNSSLSSAAGGYPAGAVLDAVGILGGFWVSTADNNTSNPDTGGANWVFAKPAIWSETTWPGAGTANSVTLTIAPAPTATAQLVGTIFQFTVASANTGAATVTINGNGPIPIVRSDGSALGSDDLGTTSVYAGVVTAGFSSLQLFTPVPSQISITAPLNLVTDTSGVANAITGSVSGVASYVVGTRFVVSPANNNTGATTLKINSLTAISVTRPDGTSLVPNDVVTSRDFEVAIVAGPAAQMIAWPQNFSGPANAVAGGSHVYAAVDGGKTTQRSNSGVGMTDALPGTGTGVLPNGWYGTIVNTDTTALLAISVASGATLEGPNVINGTIVLGPGQQASFSSNGTGYTCYGAPGRAKLAANTSIYVATTGSDTLNTGIITGSPFATGTNAYNWAQQALDLSGFQLTISIASGTYTSRITCQGPLIGQNSAVILNGAGSASTTISTTGGTGCIIVLNGAFVQPQNMAMTCSGGAAGCIGVGASFSGPPSVAAVGPGISFGAAQNSHLQATDGGIIMMLNSYTVTGGASAHWFAQNNGRIDNNNGTITVTLTGTPAFSSAFAVSQVASLINPANTITFSGSATGARYLTQSNGTINTNGSGANYLPGNSAGSGTGYF